MTWLKNVSNLNLLSREARGKVTLLYAVLFTFEHQMVCIIILGGRTH